MAKDKARGEMYFGAPLGYRRGMTKLRSVVRKLHIDLL